MTKTFKKLGAGGALALALSGATAFPAPAAIPIVNLAQPAPLPSFPSGITPISALLDNGRVPTLIGPAAPAPTAVTLRQTTYRTSSVPNRAEVAALQKALDRDGNRLPVSGRMNQRTMTALLNYQSGHGLAITGTLDSATKKELGIA